MMEFVLRCPCSFPVRHHSHLAAWPRRRQTIFRLGRYRRQWRNKLTAILERPNARQSYEELAQSYARSLQREEAQLEMTAPAAIQLMEFLESLCLLASLTFQLLPVVMAMREQQAFPRIIPKAATADLSEKTESVSVSPKPAATVTEALIPAVSVWSVLLLVAGVMFGSFVRRFHFRQIHSRRHLMPTSTAPLHGIDREEMEQSMARAFSEISHLATQMEKLRIKIRVISQDHGTALRNTDIQSTELKQSVQKVTEQLKGTERRIQDLDAIVAKLHGFTGRQFEVVSTALRRMDKECKALSNHLPVETSASVKSPVFSDAENLGT